MGRNVELKINSANLIKSAAITPLHGRDSNANINIARSAKCRTARTIRSNAAAIRMEHLTGYVGGIVRSEKYKTGGDFFRLACPAQRCIRTKRRHGWCWCGRISFSFDIQKRFLVLVSASAVATCERGRQRRKGRENPGKSC